MYEVILMTVPRVFTKEFKREALRLAKERGNESAVARDLGIRSNLIGKWRKQLEAHEQNAFPGAGNAFDPVHEKLARENADLKEQVEILKKAVGIFTSRPK